MHYDLLFPRGGPVQTSGRFAKFQRLPPEIRNMIWEYALPEARVYEVLDAPNAKHKTPARDGLMFANVHPEPPPALAAVCRESRSFVLHHYKPLTLGKTTKFIDVSRDILLLEPYLLVKRLHRTLHFMSQIPLVRDHATRLALGTSYGIYPGIFHPVLGRKVSKNNMSKLLAGLAKFPRLKTLVFVVHQEFQFEFDFRFPGTLTPMSNAYSSLPPIAPSFVPPGHGLPLSAGLGTASYPSPPASSSGGGLLSASLSPLPVSPLPQTTSTGKTTSPTTLSLPSPANSTLTTPSSSPAPPSLPLPPLVHATLHPLPQSQPPQSQSQPSPQTQPLPLPQYATSPPAPLTHLHPDSHHHHQLQHPHHHHHQQQQQQQQVHQAYRFKFDIEANINMPPRRPHTNELLYYPLDVREDEDELDEQYYYYHYSAQHRKGGGVHGGGGDDGSGGWKDRWEYCPPPSSSLNAGGGGGGVFGGLGDGIDGDGMLDGEAGEGEGEEGEWCDPWPTNDDWRRFRRRWVRAMVAACSAVGPKSSATGAVGERGLEEVEEEEAGGEKGARGGYQGSGCAGHGYWGQRGAVVQGRAGREKVCLPAWRIKGASLLWRYTRGVGGGV